jgi:hypothetical protein
MLLKNFGKFAVNMNSVVCTLFEGHYHFGLAALTNSLYQNGFRGQIFAGYRGELPPWATDVIENSSLQWPGAKTMEVSEGLSVHFLPINSDWHLTNYKPDFMLKLLDGPARDADAIAFFDPDIVTKCTWKFYERWMSMGVALVHEIVCNDMPDSHPLRLGWKEVIQKCNRKITRSTNSYINAGFCGVSRKNIEFLETWSEILACAVKFFDLDPTKFSRGDRSHLFHFGDQDAMNIAVMCSESPISEMGPEGMDFTHGGWTMAHAAGSVKPWKKNFMLHSLKGNAPSSTDRAFWVNAAFPVPAFLDGTIRIKQTCILFASFIGRFYRRY